jgi:hypothetical protein
MQTRSHQTRKGSFLDNSTQRKQFSPPGLEKHSLDTKRCSRHCLAKSSVSELVKGLRHLAVSAIFNITLVPLWVFGFGLLSLEGSGHQFVARLSKCRGESFGTLSLGVRGTQFRGTRVHVFYRFENR